MPKAWLARQVPGERWRADVWRERLSDLDEFRADLGDLSADDWHAEHAGERDAEDEAFDASLDAWEERCGYR